ncbi:hypothetical protein EB73_00080 [Mycobacterium sp. SWH-M3]|nr:hypothetical protein EB73_00080 [Mycobacterium sp. SWH-M3]
MHRQVTQRAHGVGRQFRDELRNLLGQPNIVVAGGLHLDPAQQPVAPQRRDLVRRVACRGDDQLGRAAYGQLVDERGGQRIEKLGVVDHQQQARSERVPGGAQYIGGLARRGHLDEMGHGRERHRGIGFRAGHPLDPLKVRADPVHGAARQRGLADPGGAQQCRARPLSQTGFQAVKHTIMRRDHPVDSHPPHPMARPRRPGPKYDVHAEPLR